MNPPEFSYSVPLPDLEDVEPLSFPFPAELTAEDMVYFENKMKPSPEYLSFLDGAGEVSALELDTLEAIHKVREERSRPYTAPPAIVKTQTNDLSDPFRHSDYSLEDLAYAQDGVLDSVYGIRTRPQTPGFSTAKPVSVLTSLRGALETLASVGSGLRGYGKEILLGTTLSLLGTGLYFGLITPASANIPARSSSSLSLNYKPALQSLENKVIKSETPAPKIGYAQKIEVTPQSSSPAAVKTKAKPLAKPVMDTPLPYLSCVREGTTELPWDLDISGWDRCHQVTDGRGWRTNRDGTQYLHDAVDVWGQKGKIISFTGFERGEIARVTRVVTPEEAKRSRNPLIRNAGSIIEYESTLSNGVRLVRQVLHSQKIFVHEGYTLRYGSRIAEVGRKGRTTGPHVHYEIRKYDGNKDKKNEGRESEGGKSIRLSQIEDLLVKPTYMATLR